MALARLRLQQQELGRNFVVTDLDANYVRITNEKLASMRESVDLFGSFIVPRNSVPKKKNGASKKKVEVYLQMLAQKLGRVPTEKDVAENAPSVLEQIDLVYPNRGAALKRAKVALPI